MLKNQAKEGRFKMKKDFNKIIVFILVLTLFTMSSLSSFARSPKNNGETVFVDGIEYNVRVDNKFNTTVETVGLENKAKLVIDKHGKGTISGVKGQKKGEVYEVIVNELSYEGLDVKVKSNGKEIEKFTKKEDLVKDKYTGQATIVVGGTVLAGSLVQALLAAGLIFIAAGITWVAVTEIADILQNSSSTGYFQCKFSLGMLFINPDDITRTHAVNRIKGGYDVYTYSRSDASGIVVSAGKGIIGPENHYAFWKFGDYYDHYHTGDRNGAHSFYGLPQKRSL
ncbi:hypothetical protein [Alkaliphilus hydrothermalis]|uniref:Uncharacterized protein n=1 Tax=Alkaliphilus hydrothermalis TaxID=1482730 RepID=A0ABS2NRI9_9FIRM|nr:hypothetical protein [Alkaliphilus hydrothermalis]MBM7615492.1 hypothetical protein [Alkaliphilus hydrothermalis]